VKVRFAGGERSPRVAELDHPANLGEHDQEKCRSQSIRPEVGLTPPPTVRRRLAEVRRSKQAQELARAAGQTRVSADGEAAQDYMSIRGRACAGIAFGTAGERARMVKAASRRLRKEGASARIHPKTLDRTSSRTPKGLAYYATPKRASS